MMLYEQWLGCIIGAAQNIASPEFQKEMWFPEGKVASSPDEVYQVLMEDFTIDLFSQTHGEKLTDQQVRSWKQLRFLLEEYYDKMPSHPDTHRVLDDPEWNLVRQPAERFVRAFNRRVSEGCVPWDGTQNRKQTQEP